jgi:hypothetical protein
MGEEGEEGEKGGVGRVGKELNDFVGYAVWAGGFASA